jgi:hypothetical protein
MCYCTQTVTVLYVTLNEPCQDMSLTFVMIIIVCKWGGEAQELGISLFQNM